LGEHHEFSYASLEGFRQLHVLHACIGHIDLLLKALSLAIDRLEDASDGAKDVRIH
jgi:hypothetical protein